MIEVFRKLAGIKRELPPHRFSPPVFLTGCMRSGTTFLANLLTEHPQLLHLEGELIKVWSEIGGIDCAKNRKYANRADLDNEAIVNMTAYFQQCHNHYNSTKYYWWRLINRYKKGSGGLKKDWDHLHLLNKNVHLINRLDYVLSMFPQSKAILLIRPIEAQVNSLKLHLEKNADKGIYFHKPEDEKDSWITLDSSDAERSWDFESLVIKWIQLNKTALEDLENFDDKRYFILDYTEMVNNAGNVLNQLYDFLELDKFEVKIKNTLSDRKTFNTNTSGNPLTDWEKRLTNEERNIIEGTKSKMQDDYNYILGKLNS